MQFAGTSTPGTQSSQARSGLVVSGIDIPILSASQRMQTALLRWVDICGITGSLRIESDIVGHLSSHSLLDQWALLVLMVGNDPREWSLVWQGDSVAVDPKVSFADALRLAVGGNRLASLIFQEYSDAVRYRRAAARRFSARGSDTSLTLDQLIFPVRDGRNQDFVLVLGEPVEGASIFLPSAVMNGGLKE